MPLVSFCADEIEGDVSFQFNLFLADTSLRSLYASLHRLKRYNTTTDPTQKQNHALYARDSIKRHCSD